MSKLFKALFVIGLSLAMVTPAFATWNLYGSARVRTFYVGQKAQSGLVFANQKDTLDSLAWNLSEVTRFGAKVTDGNIGGRLEFGLEGDGSGNTAYTRLLYGTYKFNGAKLLVGQNYTPYIVFAPQVWWYDNVGIGFGGLYDNRQPQLMLTLDNGAYLALIEPKADSAVGGAATFFLPKVAVGYDTNLGMMSIGGALVYNGFKVTNDATNFDKTINCYLVAVHGTVHANPVKVLYNLSYGQNVGNMHILGRKGAFYNVVAGSVKDATDYSALLAVSGKLTPSAGWNVGGGYIHDKVKDAANAATQYNIYVNAPITVAKGFSVTPEFDYFRWTHVSPGTAGINANAKSAWAFGAKWQVDF